MGIFTSKRLHAFVNGKVMCFIAYSGYRMLEMDPEAKRYYLNIDASIEKIGETILNSLKESRNLTYEESVSLSPASDKFYEEWVQEMSHKYGYKTKRSMFQKMANCSIELNENILIFEPSHHDKLEGWGATFRGEADHIRIPADSPPEKMGEAFWEALRRCTGPRPDFLNKQIS